MPHAPGPALLALFDASLEAVARRAGDPTAAVYLALFERLPHTEALFARDSDHAIRGHMLVHVLDCLRDLAGCGRYGPQMILNEQITHGELGVDPADFPAFFGVVHGTLRALGGPDWTPAIEEAWTTLMAMATRGVVATA